MIRAEINRINEISLKKVWEELVLRVSYIMQQKLRRVENLLR